MGLVFGGRGRLGEITLFGGFCPTNRDAHLFPAFTFLAPDCKLWHNEQTLGRLAQRERNCLTSSGSGVQIPHRPPELPGQRFVSLAFSFSGGCSGANRYCDWVGTLGLSGRLRFKSASAPAVIAGDLGTRGVPSGPFLPFGHEYAKSVQG